MTEQQYKEYKEIKEEIGQIKGFLSWCGDRYRINSIGRHRFSIKTFKDKFSLKRLWYCATENENTFDIPLELQKRIVKVVEDYVEEKEIELSKI